jgi:hypothetical protein
MKQFRIFETGPKMGAGQNELTNHMNINILFYMLKWKSIIFLFNCLAVFSLLSDAFGSEKDDTVYMRERIRMYHKGEESGNRKLRIVYFYPFDLKPQAGYEERITRIMMDIQEFYQKGMEQNGFSNVVFPLDMQEDKLRIHTVKSKEPAKSYSVKSGRKIQQEIRRALKEKIEYNRDFILVFHGLIRKKEDGSYLVHAPYYGDGSSSHRRGLCHVADCELLDTKLFTVTDRNIIYWEHTGTFKQTVGEFNTKYIGGIAHELGHGLSLPHNGQTREQRRKIGTALMGSGNHTYRNELRGGKGSFLTLASATRLAAHPLFTRSDHGEDEKVECQWNDMQFAAEGRELIVNGRVEANPEVYAVIAYVNPEGRSDYDSLTSVAVVKKGGFHIRAKFPRPGKYKFKLAVCHVNGAVSRVQMETTADRYGHPDAGSLSARWLLPVIEKDFLANRKEIAAQGARQILKKKGISSVIRQKLNHIITLAEGGQSLISPAKFKGNEAYLSDLKWSRARVGWMRPVRNYYNRDRSSRTSLFLEPGGKFYAKGLYAHTPSYFAYELDGRFKRLQATIGLQKGVPVLGSSIFIILGDDRELFRSKLLKGTETQEVDISIKGVKHLVLMAESGKEGNGYCWSVWGGLKITK